ncbi:Reticulon-like protein B5 [Hibiscus syriacus]|uniref:Reticulon-like protein B5 n=1 Tax=Hibiscus syriacus TaxID=106335 RepID=A0A6A3BEX0_HIBSY|nr:Reticulon-like protein B5 [Hibiscus syriacus]
MAEHEEKKHEELLIDKIADKIHGHDSSSSDSDEDKQSESSIKAKLFRLFGREKPVHHVFGGGKPADILLGRNSIKTSGLTFNHERMALFAYEPQATKMFRNFWTILGVVDC